MTTEQQPTILGSIAQTVGGLFSGGAEKAEQEEQTQQVKEKLEAENLNLENRVEILEKEAEALKQEKSNLECERKSHNTTLENQQKSIVENNEKKEELQSKFKQIDSLASEDTKEGLAASLQKSREEAMQLEEQLIPLKKTIASLSEQLEQEKAKN